MSNINIETGIVAEGYEPRYSQFSAYSRKQDAITKASGIKYDNMDELSINLTLEDVPSAEAIAMLEEVLDWAKNAGTSKE